jgi:hypothetical protein
VIKEPTRSAPVCITFFTGNSVVSQMVKLRMAQNAIFIIHCFIIQQINKWMYAGKWEQQDDLELMRGCITVSSFLVKFCFDGF